MPKSILIGQRDPLLGTFATRRKNPFRAVARLKRERTYKQAKQVIQQIRPYRLESHIYGKTNELNWDGILDRPELPSSKDWVQELGWLTHGFVASGQNIGAFLRKRQGFGAAFLLGEYERARILLDEIREEYGCSFWLAERELMLHQDSIGFEAHKKLLAELQNEIQSPLIGYLVTTLSNRLEPHVTHQSFGEPMERELNNSRKEGHQLFASLVELEVSPWTFGWKADSLTMLRWCEGRPLIDRYNTALKILALADFDELSESEDKHLNAILSDLKEAIDDPQLIHIQWALTGSCGTPPLNDGTEKFLCAYDQFVAGHYDECAKMSEEMIKKDPTSFDFFWLLARAAACTRHPTTLRKNSRAFAIIQLMQEVAENRTDLNVPLAALSTMAIKLGDNHLFRCQSSLFALFCCSRTSLVNLRHRAISASRGRNFQPIIPYKNLTSNRNRDDLPVRTCFKHCITN